MQRFERGHHFLKMPDVLPVNNQVHGECNATLADLMFDLMCVLMLVDPCSQFDLVCVGARSGNPVRRALARILKAELDMVEAGFDKLGQTLARKPDSRSDQVRVETRSARAFEQLGQIGTRQRLAPSEGRMQSTKPGGVAERAQAVGSRKLRCRRGQLQRTPARSAGRL